MPFQRASAFGLLLGAVALPAVLWLAAATTIGGFALTDAISAQTFRIYYITLLLLLVVNASLSLMRRSFASALIAWGLLLFMVQGVVWYGFRFSGEAGAGEGDQIVDYHRQERGPWAGDTRIPARVTEIPARPGDPVLFTIGEERISVPVKGHFDWKGFRVSPTAIESAPLMTLETVAGAPVESLYIKMGAAPPERDFFLVKTLPHRIYIAPDGDKGIRLRIIRDKIEVVSTTVVWAEKLKYDDHVIRFLRGAPWVRVEVERQTPRWSVVAGAVLVIAGLVSWRKRKRTEQC